MLDGLLTGDVLAALVTLTVLEIILGVDNVVFISILSGRLPEDQRPLARRVGLILALVIRIGLLLGISWVIGLTAPLFDALGRSFSGRDIILLGGGVILIAKATWEIYEKVEAEHEEKKVASGKGAFISVIAQILVMDIVFSLDSVITAVGMVDEVRVMIAAMVISMVVMLVSAGPVSDFVENHPSVKILALSFLLLIGVMLVAEGTGSHIGKGYIYGSVAFALLVEALNLRFRQKRKGAGHDSGEPEIPVQAAP